MAQWFTDFGADEYTAGVAPPDFTGEDWIDNDAYALTVEAVGGSLSGQVLRMTSDENKRGCITWDTPDAFADGDIVVLIGSQSGIASGAGQGPALRIVPAAFDAVGCRADKIGDLIRIGYHDGSQAPTEESLEAYAFTDSTDRVWIRVNLSGTAIKVRVWAAGASEPETWLYESTTAGPSAAGQPGFIFGIIGTGDTADLEAIGVSDDPNTPAPTEDVTGGGGHPRPLTTSILQTIKQTFLQAWS